MLLLMMGPGSSLLQAQSSLEQAAQLVALEGVIRPDEPGDHGRSSRDSSVKLFGDSLGGHRRGAKESPQNF